MKNTRFNTTSSTPQYLSGDMETEGTILFRITKAEVEAMATDRIIALLHPDSRGLQGLSYLLGNVTVTLPESQERHGEPFLCNQTREYCQRLYKVLPFWGFFFSVKSMSLWKLSLGLLENTRVMQFARPCDTKFGFDGEEMSVLVEGHVRDARSLGEKGLVPEHAIVAREAALRDYFGRLLVAHAD